MRNLSGFRAWFYFRQGWSLYFAFIFAAINTLTVTYFLAINNYSFLKSIFPSFEMYVLIIVFIGLPFLVIIGYAHYKKTGAHQAEAAIGFEANPFFRRMLLNTEVVLPLQLKLIQLLVKISKNENLSEEDIKEIIIIQKQIENQMMIDNKRKNKSNTFKTENLDKLKKLEE